MINSKPAHSSWWLTLPRLAISALLILGAVGRPLAAHAAPPLAAAPSLPAGDPPPTPDTPLAPSALFTTTLVMHSDYGSQSDWIITPKGGTSNGTFTGTVNAATPGLAVFDATFAPGGGSAKTDALDYGLTLWVNNQIYAPTDVFSDSGHVSFSYQNMAGLAVAEDFRLAANDDATMRVVVTLLNTGASTVNTPVYWASNLGSDANTTVYSSSNGDGQFTTADRWLITNDAPTNHDPVVTHVFAGPGVPAVSASSVFTSVYTAVADPIGVGAAFNVTIPAHTIKYLMFFVQLNSSNTAAYSEAVNDFNTNPAVGDFLVSGLSHSDLLSILNWAFTNVAPLAQDDSLLAFTDGGPRPLFVMDNDTDADRDPLNIVAVSSPAHGKVSIVPGGSFHSHLVYTPTAGYAGPDTFTYIIADGFGGIDSAQVSLTVGGPASVSLPWYLSAGPGASSIWVATNDGGSDNGLPQGGDCSNEGAINIYDAGLASHGDAFDHGLMVWLANTVITSTDQVTVSAHSLEIAPMSSPGLRASLRYTGLPGSNTLRTLATFYNPQGGPINATITLESNFGSDSETDVRATSDGNLAFTAADHWLVTSDDPTTPEDAVNTTVLFGPGAVPVPVSSVSQVVFDCSDTQGMLARFSLVVPAGGTRRLMFFSQLHASNAGPSRTRRPSMAR